jgi:hypothetical protein
MNIDIIAAFDIGSIYQNMAFYGFLLLLASLNFDISKYLGKQKEFKSAAPNH